MNSINSGIFFGNFSYERFGYTEQQAGDIIVIPYIVAAVSTLIFGFFQEKMKLSSLSLIGGI